MRGPLLQIYPSPLRGEGRVRGVSFRESPRDYARNLRHRQTDAERRLWSRLRDRRLVGAKFARQVPIGPYIVDFCCRELKLIVELDGHSHDVQPERDVWRDRYLAEEGYRVLHFTNADVLGNVEGVVTAIQLEVRRLRELTAQQFARAVQV